VKPLIFKLAPDLAPFRDWLETGAGGNTFEELMGRLYNEPSLSKTNLVLWALGIQMEAKYKTLLWLKERGAL